MKPLLLFPVFGILGLLLCGCQTPQERMERQMDQMQKMMDRMSEKLDAVGK